jgi:hypothetical protein
MEWLYEQHTSAIDATTRAGGDDESTKAMIPVFNCTGLEDSVNVLSVEDVLQPLSQSSDPQTRPPYGFREGRYEQFALSWQKGGTANPLQDASGENMVGGIFQHDSRSHVRLLALMKSDKEGYKAWYSAFCIR